MFKKGLTDDDNKNGGTLKRLDKIGETNQKLLDIFYANGGKKPAIKDPNSGNNGGNNGRLNKKEQEFKQYLINNQILDPEPNSLKTFDNIAQIRKLLKDKSIYFYKKNEKKRPSK